MIIWCLLTITITKIKTLCDYDNYSTKIQHRQRRQDNNYNSLGHIFIISKRAMLQQFHNILHTPKHMLPMAETLSRTQDLVLCSLEEMFPDNLDFSCLQSIFSDVLGTEGYPMPGEVQITVQQQVTLNYRLLEFFVAAVRGNFVHLEAYRALEEQTQRAEAINRYHIKTEQQMKMYLEYLESQINKMNRQLACTGEMEQLRREVVVCQSREALLQKEKVSLIKKNQRLQCEVEILKAQIQNLQSPKESISRSFVSRNFAPQFGLHQTSFKMRGSQINFNQAKQAMKISARTCLEKQKIIQKEYKLTHNDATQKKPSTVFPTRV